MIVYSAVLSYTDQNGGVPLKPGADLRKLLDVSEVPEDVTFVVHFRRKWDSAAAVWIYLMVGWIVLIVKMSQCSEQMRKKENATVRELSEWKELLLKRTAQPLISTGSFERHNTIRINTHNSFGVKTNSELMFILKNLEEVKINNQYEEEISPGVKDHNKSPHMSRTSSGLSENSQVRVFESLLNQEHFRESSDQTFHGKIFVKLDVQHILKRGSTRVLKNLPKSLKPFSKSQLYFEMYYSSFISDNSKCERYLVSFNEITDRMKYASLLKDVEIHHKIFDRLKKSFDQPLEQIRNHLNAAQPSVSANMSASINNKEFKDLVYIDIILEDFKLTISLLEDVHLPIVRQDRLSRFDIREEIGFVVAALSHVADERNLSIALGLDPNFTSLLYQDRIRVRQLLFNIVLNILMTTESDQVLISVRQFYHNTVEFCVRDASDHTMDIYHQLHFKFEKLKVHEKKIKKKNPALSQELGMYLVEKLCGALGPFSSYFLLQTKSAVLG